ncbi:MAG: DUF4340 domain-containing protein [Treponema sp.]|nr:DUF4340 domain-containing protein [Treponema sp.]
MKNTGTRKIVLLSLIGVLLAVYVLQLLLGGRNRIKTLSLDGEPDAIVLQTGADAAGAVRIVNRDGTWLVGVQEYPADPEIVSGMTEALGGLRLLGTVSGNADGDLDRYGLAGGGITVTASRGGKVLRTLSVGKNTSTGSQCYVRVDGASAVYLASGALHTTFSATVDAVRSKRVYSFDADEVTRVRVESADGAFVFERNPAAAAGVQEEGTVTVAQDVWRLSGADGTGAGADPDDAKVSAWVRSLATLNASTWLAEGTAAPAASPEAAVTVEAGGRQYRVAVYAGDEDAEEYVASSSESPYLFTVPPYVRLRFCKQLSDLLKQ